MTETLQPAKSEIFTTWPCTEKKFAEPWSKALSRGESKFSSVLGRYVPLEVWLPQAITAH